MVCELYLCAVDAPPPFMMFSSLVGVRKEVAILRISPCSWLSVFSISVWCLTFPVVWFFSMMMDNFPFLLTLVENSSPRLQLDAFQDPNQWLTFASPAREPLLRGKPLNRYHFLIPRVPKLFESAAHLQVLFFVLAAFLACRNIGYNGTKYIGIGTKNKTTTIWSRIFNIHWHKLNAFII